jgi:hypothetical protein
MVGQEKALTTPSARGEQAHVSVGHLIDPARLSSVCERFCAVFLAHPSYKQVIINTAQV